ncbi:hypothetical protein D1007_57751 [Hordeum vulgare]|nr:hypothetical protein D1007_57751 [Hordeum vulgare]
MAPRRKTAAIGSYSLKEALPKELEQALMSSFIASEKGLARAHILVASKHNKGARTKISLGSCTRGDVKAVATPVFPRLLLDGVVPPFCDFLLAILEHYNIRPLHLHPNSVPALASLCTSVRPS